MTLFTCLWIGVDERILVTPLLTSFRQRRLYALKVSSRASRDGEPPARRRARWFGVRWISRVFYQTLNVSGTAQSCIPTFQTSSSPCFSLLGGGRRFLHQRSGFDPRANSNEGLRPKQEHNLRITPMSRRLDQSRSCSQVLAFSRASELSWNSQCTTNRGALFRAGLQFTLHYVVHDSGSLPFPRLAISAAC